MVEYRVYAGVVTIEVDTQTGLQLLELNTSEARELQLALLQLLGPALGDAPATPVYDQTAEPDTFPTFTVIRDENGIGWWTVSRPPKKGEHYVDTERLDLLVATTDHDLPQHVVLAVQGRPGSLPTGGTE